MSSGIVAMMIGVSTFLGALGLIALIWGIRTGQFDDEKKFLDATRNDGEDELADAIRLEKRKEELVKKKKEGYHPPD